MATSRHMGRAITKDIVMTPETVAKGQKLAIEYWEKYVVPFQKD